MSKQKSSDLALEPTVSVELIAAAMKTVGRSILPLLLLTLPWVFCGPLRHQSALQPPLGRGSAGVTAVKDDSTPDWRAGLAGRKGALGFLGGLLLVILYIFTKDPETRNLKLCVRSKQFEEDFFNDPKKAEWARSKGYKRLQDPDCVEWPEFWEKIKPF